MQKVILWVLAVVIIAGGWYLWTKSGTQTPSENTKTPAQQAVDTGSRTAGTSQGAGAPAGAPTTANTGANSGVSSTNTSVTFDGKNFSPSSVTIKQGGTVTFTSTAGKVWVASNPHPTHEGYNGTTKNQHCPDSIGIAFDQCSSGMSYSFTFQKTGSWGYHDHSNPSASGVVKVVK